MSKQWNTWNFWQKYLQGRTTIFRFNALLALFPFHGPRKNQKTKGPKCVKVFEETLLAATLEPLAHSRNLASLSLFYRYYFGRCSSELAQLVPFPYSQGRSTHYSDRLHDFSVLIYRCYKDVYVNSFFPRTARLWNSLPTGCFPLTYDLNGFNSRTNRHLLSVSSF